MLDPRRITKSNGLLYLEFRCAVIEASDRCTNRHLEPVQHRGEMEIIADLGFICGTCESKGYAWYTRLLGTTDEKGDLISSLATDGIGAKTDEFRSGTDDVRTDTWLTKGGVNLTQAKIASGITVDSTQKNKGDKGHQALRGWSEVREYPEYGDVLMLRNSEARDPSSPVVERRQRTIVGLANAPKKDDPFEGMFD